MVHVLYGSNTAYLFTLSDGSLLKSHPAFENLLVLLPHNGHSTLAPNMNNPNLGQMVGGKAVNC